MFIQFACAWLQKKGNAAQEYEDACYPRKAMRLNAPSFKCAVADGATEASFSGIWASLLVKEYCKRHFHIENLRRIQKKWADEVFAKPLPWFAEEKARMGSFATLAGLHIRENNGALTYECHAFGDSCMAHVSGNELAEMFPLDSSRDFSNTPMLLPSNTELNESAFPYWKRMEAAFEPNDSFYLMTDALALWFAKEKEAGRKPWEQLEQCGPLDAFINELRGKGLIKNDDVTLIQLHVDTRPPENGSAHCPGL